MRQSELFTRTRKEVPKDEVSKNAELLLRAGFVSKEMAGLYSFLPLGLRVLNKVMAIIREEMDSIGGQEMLMTALQDPEKWQKTNRWADESVDVWFRTELKGGSSLGLANTHEEAIAAIAAQYVQSYKDLPFAAYQFQTKFRNEHRAKSGILRTREFIMKDLYSFAKSQEELDAFYDKAAAAYKRIFERAGLGGTTYMTFASGGAFSKYSHEFQTICDAGEDIIYISEEKGIAVNKEVYTDEVLADLGLKREDLRETKSIEVGNIFKLGTRFSEPLGLMFKDETGKPQPVIMGSYGIGPARLMGTIVETLSDEHGLVWPASVAPFAVHLVAVGEEPQVKERAEELYKDLMDSGVDVLYDDRDLRAGEKFADSDLLGIPWRLVVSARNMAAGTLELKERKTGTTESVNESEILNSSVMEKFKAN
ncbi:MAG TPA: aminoacyl--tRNA ligase-related protein [Candidatus Paceibacterota bacterium]|jgi:prolyl-tRNA synthetase|nr:aminoacyl--tRNA ligase-related protein [Candidatus Paceibacterota bacterium]